MLSWLCRLTTVQWSLASAADTEREYLAHFYLLSFADSGLHRVHWSGLHRVHWSLCVVRLQAESARRIYGKNTWNIFAMEFMYSIQAFSGIADKKTIKLCFQTQNLYSFYVFILSTSNTILLSLLVLCSKWQIKSIYLLARLSNHVHSY